MSIGINNSLSSVSLQLGIPEDDENRIRMLVDTGTAMNTGDFQYHMWVMYQCPDIVDTFLQCGKDPAYNVVHLATLDLKVVATDVNHSQMIAVISNKTPYIVADNGTFVLSFAWGNDVKLHYVLDLPTLLEMGA